jgi:hypothetical protein
MDRKVVWAVSAAAVVVLGLWVPLVLLLLAAAQPSPVWIPVAVVPGVVGHRVGLWVYALLERSETRAWGRGGPR